MNLNKKVTGIIPHRMKGDSLIQYTHIIFERQETILMCINRLKLLESAGDAVYGLGFDLVDNYGTIYDTVNINQAQFEYLRKQLKFKTVS